MKLAPFALAAALTLGGALAATPAHAESKIGVVDVQRAVMESEEGLRASAALKKFFDKRQQELDAKQTDLQKQRDEIEKQAKVISREALQKRMDEWQKAAMELQQVFVEYNKELQKKQNEMTQPILGKVLGVLRRLATSEGFDLIVDKQAAPYMRADLDLTDRVIQLYNSGGAGSAPAGSGAPAAPKAPSAPAKP